MSLNLMPSQFSRRAEFYQQLGQYTSAGIGLPKALEQLSRQPPAKSYRMPIRRMLEELAHGFTFTESLKRQGRWIPQFDISLLQAGENSGRLDVCFRLLAGYYRNRARMARQLLSDLAYPLFLFHFAVFLLPFPKFFLGGDLVHYLAQTLGVLLPIYAVAGFIIYIFQGRHGLAWRSAMESLLHPIPVLGEARRHLALARLSASLEGLLSAGVGIIEAWELAAEASGSPALNRAVLHWRPVVESGLTPAEAMEQSGQFPDLFVAQYRTGELSGKLEETLKSLYNYYEEEGSRKMHAVAQWTPRGVYLVVVALIAYRILNFWSGYFSQVQQAGGF